ncbi:MAG TPA: NAD(P)-dependent oxidoreductase [Ruminococcaceae bacterium]|nr:NAD(P)-dependent oxidoreductase [Oscillospiraceae bacterium]
MKRAIISGATGAVGTALIQKLIQEGTEVLVLSRKDSKRLSVLPQHESVQVKYCSLEEMATLENDTGKEYDVFYHLAWGGTFGPSRNDMYLQNRNVQYALDAVGLAKRFGCHTFLGAGSQAEYGRTDAVMSEDTPTFPETGYGIAKLCAGQMTRMVAHELGMKHIWVRILSIFGENDGAGSMISTTIEKLLNHERPVFTAGTQMWDYLYSGDAANALYLLGEKGRDGRIYVIGSGESIPLKEYISRLRDVVAPGAELGFGEYVTAAAPLSIRADIEPLKQDVGFAPQVSFEEGIRRILASRT